MSPSVPSSRRAAVRARAFELVHEVQTGSAGAGDEISHLLALAEEESWGEVARAALFGRAVSAWIERAGVHEAVGRLVDRSAADGDLVMLSLGLAMRSALCLQDDGAPSPTAEADLARATAMLESAEGGTMERISAHTACGIAFVNRWLWELADEQYAAALAIGEEAEPGTLDHLLVPVLFNRAEAQVAWASTLRQLGSPDGLAGRWQEWEAAGAAAERRAIPDSWRGELSALGTLLGAITGHDVGSEARRALAEVTAVGQAARAAGHLRLAAALSDAGAGRPGAAEETERAIATIDPSAHPHEFELALHLAAELEAAAGHSAGLRCARQQLAARWQGRLATLGSMQSRIQAERRLGELEALNRHAHLDDLTGVGNRRALERYLSGLPERGVERIALLLADLDGFKRVNDRFGHDAGDAALIRLSNVLERSVRPGDLVVRLGGDEFAAILSDADIEVAHERGQQILAQLAQVDWADIAPDLHVAVSLGVAAGKAEQLAEIKGAADGALYEAKAAGGSRVVRGEAERGRRGR